VIWLSLDMVETFHRESIVRYGGSDGLRDAGLLASALARPENIQGYEPDADIFRLAAAYVAGIVKNHPFVDGNKRTGALAGYVFLVLNGVHVELVEAEIVAMIIGLAASEVDESEIAAWYRKSAT